MDIITQLFLNSENVCKIKQGAGIGLVLGGLGCVIASLFEGSPEIYKTFKEYEFLRSSDDQLVQDLLELTTLLNINRKKENTLYLQRIYKLMNLVIGYNQLIDNKDNTIPLDSNYVIQSIAYHLEKCFALIMAQPFCIPTIGLEVCTVVEKLQEAIKDVMYNMNQEIQLRFMSERF